MADPILESSLKTRLNTMCCDIFCCKIKKVDKFQLCLKTAASLFPHCSNTNIYSYLETSGGQSSNLHLVVAHFFNTSVIRHLW